MSNKFKVLIQSNTINSPASSWLLLCNIRFLSKLGIIGNYSTKCKSSLNMAKSRLRSDAPIFRQPEDNSPAWLNTQVIFSHTLPYLLDCILSVFIQFSVFPCTEPLSARAPRLPNTLSHKNSNYPKGIKMWKECEYCVFCAWIEDTSSSPHPQKEAQNIKNSIKLKIRLDKEVPSHTYFPGSDDRAWNFVQNETNYVWLLLVKGQITSSCW